MSDNRKRAPNISSFGLSEGTLRTILNSEKEYVESMLEQYSESQSARDINGDASLLCSF